MCRFKYLLPIILPLLSLLSSLSVTTGVLLDNHVDKHGIIDETIADSVGHRHRHGHREHYFQEVSSSFILSKDFALRFDEELGRGELGASLAKLAELDNNLIDMAEMLHILPPDLIPKTKVSDLVEASISKVVTNDATKSKDTTSSASAADHDLPSGNKEAIIKPKPSSVDNSNEGIKSKDKAIIDKSPAAHQHPNPIQQRQINPKFHPLPNANKKLPI